MFKKIGLGLEILSDKTIFLMASVIDFILIVFYKFNATEWEQLKKFTEQAVYFWHNPFKTFGLLLLGIIAGIITLFIIAVTVKEIFTTIAEDREDSLIIFVVRIIVTIGLFVSFGFVLTSLIPLILLFALVGFVGYCATSSK